MQIREVFDRKRFVFLDGGMGTQLQARGLQPGQKPELAALEMPEVLTAIHTDYANAGADILLANTFGANAKNRENGQLHGTDPISPTGKQSTGKETVSSPVLFESFRTVRCVGQNFS